MSDLISRQAAIAAIEFDITYAKAINKETGEVTQMFERENKALEDAVERVRQLPTIQPEPKRGRWISADAIFGGVPFYCSECGENTRDTVMGKPRWNFCPNCGAKMER